MHHPPWPNVVPLGSRCIEGEMYKLPKGLAQRLSKHQRLKAESRCSRTSRYSGWPETGQPLFGAIEQARVRRLPPKPLSAAF